MKPPVKSIWDMTDEEFQMHRSGKRSPLAGESVCSFTGRRVKKSPALQRCPKCGGRRQVKRKGKVWIFPMHFRPKERQSLLRARQFCSYSNTPLDRRYRRPRPCPNCGAIKAPKLTKGTKIFPLQ